VALCAGTDASIFDKHLLIIDVVLSNIGLMKIIGASSLSSLLKRFLDIVWWVWIASLVIILIIGLVGIVTPTSKLPFFNMPAELTNVPSPQVLKGPAGVTVDSLDVYVEFDAPSRSLVAMQTLYMLLACAVATGFLLNLRRVLASLTEGQTFTQANARRLRAIAFFSLAEFVVQQGWEIASHLYLKGTVQFSVGVPSWPFPDISELFYVLVLFVIAEAARVGAALEEERALTV
jgi:hypothetical protein